LVFGESAGCYAHEKPEFSLMRLPIFQFFTLEMPFPGDKKLILYFTLCFLPAYELSPVSMDYLRGLSSSIKTV